MRSPECGVRACPARQSDCKPPTSSCEAPSIHVWSFKMKQKAFIGASLLAAIAASLCCVLPIVFALGGFAIVGASAFFESLRPYFVIATFALLGVGFYLAYRKPKHACEPGSACARPQVSRFGRIGLWIATALALAFTAFPYYSGAVANFLLSDGSVKASAAQAANAVEHVSFAVRGMYCPACTKGRGNQADEPARSSRGQRFIRAQQGRNRVRLPHREAGATGEGDPRRGLSTPKDVIQLAHRRGPMKALGLFAILLLFAASAMAKDSTAQIKVSGMTCGACAVSVKRRLEKSKGGKTADVSVEKGLATVVYDDSQVNAQQLREAINKTGFKAEPSEEKK